MRWPLFTPIAISALATLFVLTSNSAKLVARPSNSNAMASPRLLARSRTMSARLANGCVVMFLPYRLVLMPRSVASSAGDDKMGEVQWRFRVPDALQRSRAAAQSRDPFYPRARNVGPGSAAHHAEGGALRCVRGTRERT